MYSKTIDFTKTNVLTIPKIREFEIYLYIYSNIIDIFKVHETIKQLRRNIQLEKNTKHQEEIETNNENSKLLELKKFTQTTKEIVIILKNYVESLEQRTSKLNFKEIENGVFKNFEDNSNMIHKRINTVNTVKKEILALKSEYNIINNNNKYKLHTKISLLEKERNNLQKKMDSLLERNQQLSEQKSTIEKELRKKNEDEIYYSAKVKEFYEYTLKHIDDQKLLNEKLQELEFKRNCLLNR